MLHPTQANALRLGQTIHHHETNIVPVAPIFAAHIAQADNQVFAVWRRRYFSFGYHSFS
jgi:hypothetical protein